MLDAAFHKPLEAFDMAKLTCAVLPVGAFEQHGPHLPMTTDSLIAGILGKAVAEQVAGLLLPPLPISCSHEHAGFAGSTSISATTLVTLIRDIFDSVTACGLQRLVVINGHGGNYVLRNLAQEINLTDRMLYLGPEKHIMTQAFERAGLETSVHDDMHAGEYETSVMLAYHGDLVRHDRLSDELAGHRDQLLIHGMAHYTRSGVIGCPSKASAEMGFAVVKAISELMSGEINALFAGSTRPDPGFEGKK